MVYQNQSGIGIPYAVGLIPCVFLFYENVLIKNSQFILWLASATFGVYLSHVFVLLVMSYIGITGYMLPIITFILAILAILIVRFYVPKNLVKYVT
jgi:peptidoglycan/LPS O-acetylase OafA/YrhL